MLLLSVKYVISRIIQFTWIWDYDAFQPHVCLVFLCKACWRANYIPSLKRHSFSSNFLHPISISSLPMMSVYRCNLSVNVVVSSLTEYFRMWYMMSCMHFRCVVSTFIVPLFLLLLPEQNFSGIFLRILSKSNEKTEDYEFPGNSAFYVVVIIMWCDLGNRSEVEHVTFSVFYLIEVIIRGSTFCWKPPPESDQWFQSYSNEKILKTIEMHSFLCISQSMLPTSDWSR